MSPYYQDAPNRDRVLRNSGPSRAHVVRSYDGAVCERGPLPRPQVPEGNPGRSSGERGARQRRSLVSRGETACARVSPSGAPIRNRSVTQRQPDLQGALVGCHQRGKGRRITPPPKGAALALRPSPRSHSGPAYLSSAKAPPPTRARLAWKNPGTMRWDRAARLTLNRSLTRCRCGTGAR